MPDDRHGGEIISRAVPVFISLKYYFDCSKSQSLTADILYP